MHHEDRKELILQTLLRGATLEETKTNEKTLARHISELLSFRGWKANVQNQHRAQS